MIIGIVGLVVLLGAGAYFFREDLLGAGEAVDAAGSETRDVDSKASEGAAGTEPAPTGPSAPAPEDGQSAGLPGADAGPAPVADAGEQKSDAAPDKDNKRDPDAVDLSIYADFGPVDDTTPEEWQELEDKLELAMDAGSGAGQIKAQKFLEERGRKAFPVILNHMKELDLSTEAHTRQGMWSQRMLQTITNGANFGWKEFGDEVEPGDRYYEWYNKVAVNQWCKAWLQAENSLKAWKSLAKIKDGDSSEEPTDDEPLEDDEPSTADLLEGD